MNVGRSIIHTYIHTYKGQQTIAILIQPLNLLPTFIVDEVDVLLDIHITECIIVMEIDDGILELFPQIHKIVWIIPQELRHYHICVCIILPHNLIRLSVVVLQCVQGYISSLRLIYQFYSIKARSLAVPAEPPTFALTFSTPYISTNKMMDQMYP